MKEAYKNLPSYGVFSEHSALNKDGNVGNGRGSDTGREVNGDICGRMDNVFIEEKEVKSAHMESNPFNASKTTDTEAGEVSEARNYPNVYTHERVIINRSNHFTDEDKYRRNYFQYPVKSDYRRMDIQHAYANNACSLKNDLRKTSICKYWLKGICANIDCNFAHGEHELKYTYGVYKTTICKHWKKNGLCSSGINCRHAHGENELQPKILPIHLLKKKNYLKKNNNVQNIYTNGLSRQENKERFFMGERQANQSNQTYVIPTATMSYSEVKTGSSNFQIVCSEENANHLKVSTENSRLGISVSCGKGGQEIQHKNPLIGNVQQNCDLSKNDENVNIINMSKKTWNYELFKENKNNFNIGRRLPTSFLTNGNHDVDCTVEEMKNAIDSNISYNSNHSAFNKINNDTKMGIDNQNIISGNNREEVNGELFSFNFLTNVKNTYNGHVSTASNSEMDFSPRCLDAHKGIVHGYVNASLTFVKMDDRNVLGEEEEEKEEEHVNKKQNGKMRSPGNDTAALNSFPPGSELDGGYPRMEDTFTSQGLKFNEGNFTMSKKESNAGTNPSRDTANHGSYDVELVNPIQNDTCSHHIDKRESRTFNPEEGHNNVWTHNNMQSSFMHSQNISTFPRDRKCLTEHNADRENGCTYGELKENVFVEKDRGSYSFLEMKNHRCNIGENKNTNDRDTSLYRSNNSGDIQMGEYTIDEIERKGNLRKRENSQQYDSRNCDAESFSSCTYNDGEKYMQKLSKEGDVFTKKIYNSLEDTRTSSRHSNEECMRKHMQREEVDNMNRLHINYSDTQFVNTRYESNRMKNSNGVTNGQMNMQNVGSFIRDHGDVIKYLNCSGRDILQLKAHYDMHIQNDLREKEVVTTDGGAELGVLWNMRQKGHEHAHVHACADAYSFADGHGDIAYRLPTCRNRGSFCLGEYERSMRMQSGIHKIVEHNNRILARMGMVERNDQRINGGNSSTHMPSNDVNCSFLKNCLRRDDYRWSGDNCGSRNRSRSRRALNERGACRNNDEDIFCKTRGRSGCIYRMGNHRRYSNESSDMDAYFDNAHCRHDFYANYNMSRDDTIFFINDEIGRYTGGDLHGHYHCLCERFPPCGGNFPHDVIYELMKNYDEERITNNSWAKDENEETTIGTCSPYHARGSSAGVDAVVTTEELAAAEAVVTTEELAAAEAVVTTEELAGAEAAVTTEELAGAEAVVTTEELAAAEAVVTTEELAAAEAVVTTEELTDATAAQDNNNTERGEDREEGVMLRREEGMDFCREVEVHDRSRSGDEENLRENMGEEVAEWVSAGCMFQYLNLLEDSICRNECDMVGTRVRRRLNRVGGSTRLVRIRQMSEQRINDVVGSSNRGGSDSEGRNRSGMERGRYSVERRNGT
ncbi:zinc finger protein, putative [Plasmodium ovale]|uniref:Zinc finger protein, putative n=1 Tax=Plasmodium ovale TaxID=36330 RepID=A0A1D3TMI0_PLAOA|nr:zinc finger protein, putative [Plasmodium ovale]